MELIYEQAIRLIVAVILGGIIGLERELHQRPAGLRTHILVCVASALITIISIDYFPGDSARIIAGIVTGIGFIGAGNIIAQGNKGIHGVTTAANIWAVAAVGICVGIGQYVLASVASLIALLILFLGKFEKKIK